MAGDDPRWSSSFSSFASQLVRNDVVRFQNIGWGARSTPRSWNTRPPTMEQQCHARAEIIGATFVHSRSSGFQVQTRSLAFLTKPLVASQMTMETEHNSPREAAGNTMFRRHPWVWAVPLDRT